MVRKWMFPLDFFPFSLRMRGVLGLFDAGQQRQKRLAVEGDQGIEIFALAVYGLVGGEEDDDERDTDEKAPHAEETREDQQHYPHKLEGVAELVGALREVCDGYEGGQDYYLGYQPAEVYCEVSEYQTADDGEGV